MSEENWITFYREATPTGVVISVNQSVSSGRVAPKYGNCYEMRFEFRAAQLADNGMPNKETQAIFYRIEDELENLIGSGKGEMIATRTGQKMRSVWWSGSTALTSRIQGMVDATRTITVTLRPSSLSQIKALHPTKMERHLVRDEGVVETLAEKGDDHSIPRKIDHFIDGVTNRKAIKERLKRLGFELEPDQPDAILFYRISPIDLNAIQRDTRTLLDLCDELGCEYDGWGTEVTQRTH